MDNNEKMQRELLAKIHQEVEFEPGDDTHFVNLKMLNGIATIKGAVPSYADKMAILKILQTESGVLGWKDDLVIKIPEEHRRTDEEIAAAARDAINDITTIRPDTIRISVEDGWVCLEGTVEHWCQRECAEYAVQCLTGLRGVLNLIWAAEHRVPEAPPEPVYAK